MYIHIYSLVATFGDQFLANLELIFSCFCLVAYYLRQIFLVVIFTKSLSSEINPFVAAQQPNLLAY